MDLTERTERHQGLVQSYMGKMRGTAVRIALVLQYFAWAEADGDAVEPREINASSVDAAIEMVDSYILPMAFRTLAGKRKPGAESDAAVIGRWLAGNFTPTINVRELKRLPGFPIHDQDRIEAALNVLVDGGWIRPAPVKTGGRMRRDYGVNPAIARAPSAKSAKSLEGPEIPPPLVPGGSLSKGARSVAPVSGGAPFGSFDSFDALLNGDDLDAPGGVA